MTNQESQQVSIEELEIVSGGDRRLLVERAHAAGLTRGQLKEITAAGRRAQARRMRGAELTRDQLKRITAGANRRDVLQRARQAARRAQDPELA